MLGRNNFYVTLKKYSDNRIIYTLLLSPLAGSDRNAFSKTVKGTWDMAIKSCETGKIAGQRTSCPCFYIPSFPSGKWKKVAIWKEIIVEE